MEIPGWAYIGIGVLVSGISGYVYKFIPKPTGEPNMSMALFFFIGMIFIIVGVIRLSFKKISVEQDIVIKKQQEHLQNTALKNVSKVNRVEEQINAAYNRQNTQGHTSSYAKSHPYTQNIHNDQTSPQQAAHAIYHNPQNIHQTEMLQATITEKIGVSNKDSNARQPVHQIINCPKCGTKNYTHSNFCHVCGNKLK